MSSRLQGTNRRHVAEALGLPRVAGNEALVVALWVDSFGTGLYLPMSLLYFTVVAGLPLVGVGEALSLATAVSLPLPGLVGWSVDRIGARRVVILAEVLQGVGFAAYLGVRTLPTLFGAALAVTVGQRLFWSSIFTLVTDTAERDERDRWYGLAGMAQSAGIGLGTLVTGGLLAIGGKLAYRMAVVGDVASFAVAALVLAWRVREPAASMARQALRSSRRATAATVWRDGRFLWLMGIETVLALCATMLSVALPVYVVRSLDAPRWVLGPLLALNTAVLAVGQGVVVRASTGRRRTRALALAAALWAVWAGGLAGIVPLRGGLLLVALFGLTLVYSLAEVIHAPLSNSLAAGLAPPAARGRYLGSFQYSYAMANTLAPVLFTGLFALEVQLPWELLVGLALLAGCGLLALERHLPPAALTGGAA